MFIRRRKKAVNRAVLVPSLVIAAGMIISTLVAARTADSGRLVLVAPLIMAVSILGATMISPGRTEGSTPVRLAFFLGAALILASAIVASRNPADVAELMPILSVASASPILILMKRQCVPKNDAS